MFKNMLHGVCVGGNTEIIGQLLGEPKGQYFGRIPMIITAADLKQDCHQYKHDFPIINKDLRG